MKDCITVKVWGKSVEGRDLFWGEIPVSTKLSRKIQKFKMKKKDDCAIQQMLLPVLFHKWPWLEIVGAVEMFISAGLCQPAPAAGAGTKEAVSPMGGGEGRGRVCPECHMPLGDLQTEGELRRRFQV